MKDCEYLFAYGTLREEEVQVATFGRRLEGKADALTGYRLAMITIEDQEFVAKSGAEHRNLQFTGNESDAVEGMVFEVRMQELRRADEYEPAGYERVAVRLRSGIEAWVYLDKRNSLNKQQNLEEQSLDNQHSK